MGSMKKPLILVFATLAALAPSVFAQDAQKALQAQYEKRADGAKKKEVATALAINAPDFVSLDIKGNKRTLTQIKPQLAEAFASAASYSVSTKITKCTVTGDTALVNTSDRVKVTMTDNKTTQEAETTNTDTWVKKSGQWLRQQSKMLTSKVKVNGKAIN